MFSANDGEIHYGPAPQRTAAQCRQTSWWGLNVARYANFVQRFVRFRQLSQQQPPRRVEVAQIETQVRDVRV